MAPGAPCLPLSCLPLQPQFRLRPLWGRPFWRASRLAQSPPATTLTLAVAPPPPPLSVSLVCVPRVQLPLVGTRSWVRLGFSRGGAPALLLAGSGRLSPGRLLL
ncbi:Uncharacterized protein M6B38_229720 [Iris pallida]|uniref:Uncharacterized protein n=1 Tax=Iris pallida TaxID=29817 RepID=A0AAX6DSJ4_IRIPA|nr:Uncharacterized protein M6B38_229720 [Iris pallida]